MSSDTLVANDPDAWTIALVGAPRVGKTRFISRFVLDDFEELESSGPKGFSRHLTVDKQKTVVTLLDIYHGVNEEEAAEAQLRDADAFILMYSSTSPYSLQDVVAYTRAVCRAYGQDPLLALVANQCDRPAHDQEVSLQEGTALARELDCVFLQVSAKTGEGVQAVVKDLVRRLRARGRSKQNKRALGLWTYLTRR
ncbi:P-loop containing nucleoside triphosphate hydrolase protein [Roridomyces roridus]|uniref:small monomeric GTPase n=1 Tax=Roridomyces roridus TaxID=1738132 RepID=A0AAD7FNQ9_9AGAR|nr:P-loop containing nucleoside triphosphate hydrolase protein [Roridomyces roridus]